MIDYFSYRGSFYCTGSLEEIESIREKYRVLNPKGRPVIRNDGNHLWLKGSKRFLNKLMLGNTYEWSYIWGERTDVCNLFNQPSPQALKLVKQRFMEDLPKIAEKVIRG